MFLLLQNLKNFINEKFIIKLFLNFVIIFIFTIIYFNYRNDFKVDDENKVTNITESIYLCLSIHTSLGLGDILPKFNGKNEKGIKIIICHILSVILLVLL